MNQGKYTDGKNTHEMGFKVLVLGKYNCLPKDWQYQVLMGGTPRNYSYCLENAK